MAFVPPSYNGKMNQAIGGIIEHKAGKWGFANNDPRVGATMNGIGAAVTTLALGVGTGTVATVGWPALLVAAGITALVTGAVALGQDALYKWIFNSDGTISTEGSAVSVDSALQSGYCYTWPGENICVGTKDAVCSALPSNTSYSSVWGRDITTSYAWLAALGQCVMKTSPIDTGCGPDGSGCPVGVPTTKPGTPTAVPSPGVINVPPDVAVEAVPEAEAAKPLSDTMLAAAANAAWKAMAATQPSALPWSATDPITQADVAEWKVANPQAVPTVSDALAPVAAPQASAVPVTQPGSQTQSGTAPSPGQGTQVDLGPDPNIGAPNLEAIPTAQQILDPILNLMPDLRNFSVPGHAAECPKPSFSVWGKSYILDSQCGLIEGNRSIIEAAMLLVWTIAAVFIVLRA